MSGEVSVAPSQYGELTPAELSALAGDFKATIGDPIPFCKPNVNPGTEKEELERFINKKTNDENRGWNALGSFLALFIPGYFCCTHQLIEEGEYGFSMNNGRPKLYTPGRYFLTSPVEYFQGKRSVGDDRIHVGPISIIRVPQGKLGLAMNNSRQEVLLPGVHCRQSAAFKFDSTVPIEKEVIEYGPLKFVTVKSGEVRVCYNQGKVRILEAGRYAINSGPFTVAHTINTTIECMRFSKHPVLLDGGISLLVEGLLSFQVVDVEKLIKQLGDRDLEHAIEDVTKAEIARVFAGIHLEQISTATVDAQSKEPRAESPSPSPEQKSLLGEDRAASPGETEEFAERSKICDHVLQYVRPITDQWGVSLLNFQLESTQIADQQYASEYEQASLGMAKAKANLRSVDAENDILIRQAQAKAKAVIIAAEGAKNSTIIEARGNAESRKIDAASRNEAAKLMSSDFARQYALQGQQVLFAKNLKAQVLTVLPESVVGNPIANQQMLSGVGAPKPY